MQEQRTLAATMPAVPYEEELTASQTGVERPESEPTPNKADKAGHYNIEENDGMHLQVYRDSPYTGFYEDVMYPVTTLFCPPQPPSDMPPRVLPPPRPAKVWKNDLAIAGEVEHSSQTMVSKIWRGIMCRRELQRVRTFEHAIFSRARTIQCWWRSTKAQERHTKLAAFKKEWVEKRRNDYIAEKLQAMSNIMTWQRTRYEGAAITIQRVVRWHLNRRDRENCRLEGLDESEWPVEIECPVEHKVTRYFPWRRRQACVDPAQQLANMIAEGEESGEPRRRTILEFKEKKDPVKPPGQKDVEEKNKNMRRRTHQRQISLAAPEVRSRLDWKQENLRKEDLDFNAGVIQRLFRTRLNAMQVDGKHLTRVYMDNVVRVIARTFRMYVLVNRLKMRRRGRERQIREKLERYSRDKIEEIKHKLVWGKELLDSCAATIQRCWFWHRYRRYGELPAKIQKELDRRHAIKQEKADREERERREREELVARLKAELGMDELPAAAAAPAAEEPAAEAEAEGEDAAAPAEEQPALIEEKAPEAEGEAPAEAEAQAEGELVEEEEEPEVEVEEKPVEEEEEEEGEFVYENPTAPPYGLISEFLAREEELRDAMLSLLEKNNKEMVKNHKYLRYTPEKVIERKQLYTVLPRPQ